MRVAQELAYLSENNETLLAYPDFSPNLRLFREIDPYKTPFRIKRFPLGEAKDGGLERLKEIIQPVRKKQLESLKCFIKDFSPDVIHHHFGALNRMLEGVMGGRNLGIPQVATFHVSWPFCIYGTYFNYHKKSPCVEKKVCAECISSRSKMSSRVFSAIYSYTVARKVFSSIDHYICYTPYHQHILENLEIDASKITVLPPGICPLSQITVKDFSERRYITYSGRFSEEKGVYLFLEVARRFKDSAIEFLMIGDGYLKEDLQEKAKEESLKIKFIDWTRDRDEYVDFINQTKIMIVPSIWPETFGMVILDAFQCGTPVIGTDRGGIPHIIENNKNGFVVSPDPVTIAEKIKILLEDSYLWQQFSNYGLECIAKTATWQENATQLQQIYTSILKQKLLLSHNLIP